jgi:hypothetical protein
MEVVHSSEMSGNFYQITRSSISSFLKTIFMCVNAMVSVPHFRREDEANYQHLLLVKVKLAGHGS